MVSELFDGLSSALISFCITVINLLPDSPFLFLERFTAPATIVMSYVNWFVDFGTILDILTAWCICVLAWYAYQVVLRWIKAIE